MTDGLLRAANHWRARPAGRRRRRWRLTRRGRVVFGGGGDVALLASGDMLPHGPVLRQAAARQGLEASRDRTSRAVGPAAPPLPPD